jgi:hypothetical protein
MCIGCYEDYELPRIVTPEVVAMSERIKSANPFGGLHIVVEDWNLEDLDIEFCRDSDDATNEERQLASDLLAMTLEQRASAMALADGYLLPNGEFSEFVKDALTPAD